MRMMCTMLFFTTLRVGEKEAISEKIAEKMKTVMSRPQGKLKGTGN